MEVDREENRDRAEEIREEIRDRAEEIREEIRDKIAENRVQMRAKLQDARRQIDPSCFVADIQTEDEMKETAKQLTQKCAVTAELLISIKNGLLRSKHMIRAFMEVDAALPALLRLFSCTGVDARLQVLAGHCICNLALGDEKDCLRLVRMCGSYLVMRMEGIITPLTEASVWAVGNLSSHSKAAEILHHQGAYSRAVKLLSPESDPTTRSAAIYCLNHTLTNNPINILSGAEYVLMVSLLPTVPEADARTLFLHSLIALVPGMPLVLKEKNAEKDALKRLRKLANPEDADTVIPLIRIVHYMAMETSGVCATRILFSKHFEPAFSRLLHGKINAIIKEATYTLLAFSCHSCSEIRLLAQNMQLISLYPPTFNVHSIISKRFNFNYSLPPK